MLTLENRSGMFLRSGHAVAQLVEALRYKPKDAVSISDGVIKIFH
jgi:hypothetical protein